MDDHTGERAADSRPQTRSRAEQIALDLIRRGISPVPVPRGEKNPTKKGWQHLRITAADVSRYFGRGDPNVGAIMGAASNGLTDVDLDCTEAVALAPYFLPRTNSIYGRPGKKRSHYLYTCNDPDPTAYIKLTDVKPDGGMGAGIVELRLGGLRDGVNKGAQSIMPGSIHKSGEHYEYDEDGVRATVPCAKLKAAIVKIAVGTILIRRWPGEGSRHQAVFELGGFLARAGWTPDDIEHFATTLCEVHGGHRDNAAGGKAARDSAENYARGVHVAGMPKMIEIFTEPAAKQIAKLIGYKARGEGQEIYRQPGDPTWREQHKGGSPVPSVHNAMLAITAIGVACSHDLFHNTFLVGYKDDIFRHELQSLVGEITDNAILMLRHILSKRFGLDFTDKHTRDAVTTMALEHQFDPVCDMLDEAERNWDGKKRLPALAKDYFNCANTPLNRAFLRKTMIALVHRARHPGCKFDNILTLESEEGWNKSTLFRVLAGDENFSDQTILGKDEREVQETMAGVLIHESADLAGMRKADVDKVKAFASRQDDRSRPAYGHYSVRQKRRGINVGTTNSDEYLKSQTGNRRFWPVKVLAPIDIDKWKRDRLQLLGEAAKYERAEESVTIPENLWQAARDAQEERRVADSWEYILADIPEIVTGGHFEIKIIDVVHDPERGKEQRVSSANLLTHVLRVPAGTLNSSHSMRLSDAMRHLGWKRPEGKKKLTINGKQERGYYRPVPAATQSGQGAGSGQPGTEQVSSTADRRSQEGQ